MIQKFCLDCHDASANEGDINLEVLEHLDRVGSSEKIDGGTLALAKRAMELIRFGAMPPEDSEVPTPDERKRLVELMHGTSFAAICDLVPRPGKVTVRRLNRLEYNFTVSDLFEQRMSPADSFPSDEVGAGFDNNGDVLSLPPMLFEKYMAAADDISRRVILDPRDVPHLEVSVPSDRIVVEGDVKNGSFYGRFLKDDAYAWMEFETPLAGQYTVTFRGGRSQKEYAPAADVNADKSDSSDSKKESKQQEWKQRFAIYNAQGKLLTGASFGYYGGSGRSDSETFRFDLPKGLNRLIVVPVDHQYLGDNKTSDGLAETFAGLDELTAARLEAGRRSLDQSLKVADRSGWQADYPAMVRSLEISGPNQTPRYLYPPSHFKIIKGFPPRRRGKFADVERAASRGLGPFMRRAFRGPVDDQTVQRYAGLVREATDRGESYERGMQIAVAAVLVSPRFLFRIESPAAIFDSGSVRFDEDERSVPLNDYQIATRLAYFLWSSTPDDRLLQLAHDGKLRDEQRLRWEVQRMLKDEKSDRLATTFAEQWLGLRNLNDLQPDTSAFPEFDDQIREDMLTETRRVFLHALRENESVVDLLDQPKTFLNERLAKYYGIDGVRGEAFQRVDLSDSSRRGLLSHASILTLTSYPTRTSPVLRGKWILENVLGTPPPDPPAGVPELEAADPDVLSKPLRDQLAIHRADPGCAGCHRVMDQLGFGFESFDAIGRMRPAVDSSGELPGGKVFKNPAELTGLLKREYSRQFATTFTHRLMTFALGRELTPQDDCVIQQIVDDVTKKDPSNSYRMQDVIFGIVMSRPFRYFDLPEDVKIPSRSATSE
ncbi:MAG: DUF1592 domain-containing protein [Planctomycetota bacterium]